MTDTFKELARNAALGTAPAEFTISDVNKSFAEELKKYCGSINQFMKNRYDLYEVIVENADEIAIPRVTEMLSSFADVRIVPQGTKVTFKVGTAASKMRARKFLTRVGLSGVYETFRLDTDNFEVSADAIGIAGTIDFERMMDGVETLADVMEVITNSLADGILMEVQKALKAVATATPGVHPGVPAANRVVGPYSATNMVKLCNIAKAYSDNGTATIFAPPEFIAAMGPDAIVPAIASAAQGIYSPKDIDAIHEFGRIFIFRGNPVVEIPQTFVDTNNDKVWIDPQIAYILPNGKEKIVKVILEGQTQIWDLQNTDNSLEVHAYKKVGVAITTLYNFCTYQNTSIADNSVNPFGL